MAQNFLAAARRLATLALALAAACGGQDPPTVGGPDPDAVLRMPKKATVTVRPDASLHPLITYEAFGQSVALAGAHVVVLDYAYSDAPAAHADAFEVSGDQATWAGSPTLPPEATSCFGRKILIEEDLLLVADPCAGGGLVQPYHLERGAWIPEAPLTLPPERGSAAFGWSMDASANRLVVGAPYESTFRDDGSEIPGAGAAYAFKRVDGVWRLEGRLAPPAPADWYQFGRAVATSGGAVAVSEPFRPGLASAPVFLFETTATGALAPAEILEVPEMPVGELAFCGGELAVAGMSEQVRVHLYARAGPRWTRSGTIDDDGNPFAVNSSAYLACDGSTMALGFPYNSVAGIDMSGEVRIFGRGNRGWLPKLTLEGASFEGILGRGLDVHGGVVAIGAPGAPLGEIAPGAVILIRP